MNFSLIVFMLYYDSIAANDVPLFPDLPGVSFGLKTYRLFTTILYWMLKIARCNLPHDNPMACYIVCVADCC